MIPVFEPFLKCVRFGVHFNLRPFNLLTNGARDENRTHTGIPIRPSNVRVYQFRHSRIKLLDYFMIIRT